MATIQTVTGPVDSADLGQTLMHEHLTVGYPGWICATGLDKEDEGGHPHWSFRARFDDIAAVGASG